MIGRAKYSYLKGCGNREGCRNGAVFVIKPSVLPQPTPQACTQLPYFEFLQKLILRQGFKYKKYVWEVLLGSSVRK